MDEDDCDDDENDDDEEDDKRKDDSDDEDGRIDRHYDGDGARRGWAALDDSDTRTRHVDHTMAIS